VWRETSRSKKLISGPNKEFACTRCPKTAIEPALGQRVQEIKLSI
jgi:hypothetical protein